MFMRNGCRGMDVVADVDGVAGVLRIARPSDAAVGRLRFTRRTGPWVPSQRPGMTAA